MTTKTEEKTQDQSTEEAKEREHYELLMSNPLVRENMVILGTEATVMLIEASRKSGFTGSNAQIASISLMESVLVSFVKLTFKPEVAEECIDKICENAKKSLRGLKAKEAEAADALKELFAKAGVSLKKKAENASAE